MPHRVTLQDVAREANVSTTTVSLALRDDPRLASDTIVRVRGIAGKLGYRRDPWLTSLSSYRNRQHRQTGHLTIATLTNWATKDAWKSRETFMLYYTGAMQQAESLGFQLEEFWLPEYGSERRMADILYHRGIKGVLLLPLPTEQHILTFNFDKFAAVQLGRSIHCPPLHSVSHNHFKSVATALEKLLALGYKRIGLALRKADDDIQYARWSGAFLGRQLHLSSSIGDIPVHFSEQPGKDAFLYWAKAHQCDAVLSTDMNALLWMREKGYKVPQDIGYVHLALDKQDEVSGIYLNSTQTGVQAINLLSRLMTTGRHGTPETPFTLEVDGSWHPGNTIRAIT